MILMKRVYVDIISEKEKKLHQLQSDAEGAVDTGDFRSGIGKL